jgi:3-oxoacyl-[acyl-carrier-protein] synthase III
MIVHLDYLIPETKVSVKTVIESMDEKDIPTFFETKEDAISFYENVLNLKEVADAKEKNELDLFDELITKNINQKTVDPSEIDLIIIIDDALQRGNRMPNFGQYIQHSYGFNKADVLILSGNHCSNIEYAITYAELMLKSEMINNILIVGINKVKHYPERVIENYAIMGDGIGIVVLSSKNEKGVKVNGSFSLTHGAFYEADLSKIPPILLYKNYTLCISGLLKKYKLSPSMFSEIILQNANISAILECFKSLGFKTKKMNLDHISEYGHIDCIDFIINLKRVVDKNIEKSTKIISFGNGYAGSNICLNLETL